MRGFERPDRIRVRAAPATTPIRPPPLPGNDADGPISPRDLDELAQASQRGRKALAAAGVATFNGWTAAILAGLALPFVLCGPTALVMAIGLAIVSFNEFRGRKLVRRFDLRGPRLLGLNQLGFMGLIIGYSLWSIWVSLAGPQPYEEEIRRNPQLASMLGSIGSLHRSVTLAVYGGLIVGSVLFQGLTALYYFSRAGHLRAYLDQTPPWIVELQRHTSSP